jgi:hypothetical protein
MMPPSAPPAPRATDRRARLRRCAIAFVAVSALTSSCAGPSTPEDGARATVIVEVPVPEPEAQAPDSMTFFLVLSGPTDLFLEPSQVFIDTAATDELDRARLSIEALLNASASDSPGFLRPELTSTVPAGTALNAISVADGVVTLDLSGDLAATSGSSSEERALAQQLAHTALVSPTFTSLRLLLDGAPVTELWGHLDWSVPITADPLARAPVTIVEPGPGSTRSGWVSMAFVGETSAPGATVLLRLEDEAGTVLAEGSVVASAEGSGAGRWAAEVYYPGPGTWVVVASVTPSSSGGPTVPFEARRAFDADS